MYIWKSQIEPDNLIFAMQSNKDRRYCFKIKHSTNFTLVFLNQFWCIPLTRIPIACPRILKGTITKKGVGCEVTAFLRIPVFEKVVFGSMIVLSFLAGIYALMNASWSALLAFFIGTYLLAIVVFSKGDIEALLEFISTAADTPYIKVK